jgi:hypothetical protein
MVARLSGELAGLALVVARDSAESATVHPASAETKAVQPLDARHIAQRVRRSRRAGDGPDASGNCQKGEKIR